MAADSAPVDCQDLVIHAASLYPDEGHGFAVPENRLSFWAIAEAFLAAHLGGRAEPIGGDFQGAKFEVREGAAHVPGLKAPLASGDSSGDCGDSSGD